MKGFLDRIATVVVGDVTLISCPPRCPGLNLDAGFVSLLLALQPPA
jgi:hypothetical protein